MRIVLTILGALLGLALSSHRMLFCVLLGAAAGWGLAEVALLRHRLRQTETELSDLGRRLARLRRELDEPERPQAQVEPAQARAARPAPEPAWTPVPGLTPPPPTTGTPPAAPREEDLFAKTWR